MTSLFRSFTAQCQEYLTLTINKLGKDFKISKLKVE